MGAQILSRAFGPLFNLVLFMVAFSGPVHGCIFCVSDALHVWVIAYFSQAYRSSSLFGTVFLLALHARVVDQTTKGRCLQVRKTTLFSLVLFLASVFMVLCAFS